MRTRVRGRAALITVVAASVLVASACVPERPTVSGAPAASAEATEKPQLGGRVIEGSTTDIATLQPALAIDTPSSRVIGLIYDSILAQDPKSGEIRSKLATFNLSSDGLTYTFEMNARANWSDGRPIVAEDYLTTLKAIGKSARTVRKSAYQDIEGFSDFCAPAGVGKCTGTASTISGVKIDAANPKKWSVKMTRVSCPAILDLNSQPPLPAHVFGKYLTATSGPEEIDNAPENRAPTVASGPFKFKEWRRGDQVILSRNDSYWQGAPHVEEFVYRIVADSSAITNGLKTGEITFGSIIARDLAGMQAVDSVTITKYQSLSYTFIGWNTNSQNAPGLADKRVRQALAYGLDMESVIRAVVFGEASPQVAHHVPVQWAYPSAPLERYRYDKARAEQLLRDAGWVRGSDGTLAKDGKRFTLTIVTNSGSQERETVAQVAADQYKQLGIDARVLPEAFQSLVTKLQNGDPALEATILGWSLGGDVDPYQPWHSSQIPDPAKKKTGSGLSGFKDAAMDRAIEEGRNPSNGDCSVAARKKHYETFNRILNENQPYNFGYSPNTIAVSQKALQNFRPASYSTLHNVHEWWFKK